MRAEAAAPPCPPLPGLDGRVQQRGQGIRLSNPPASVLDYRHDSLTPLAGPLRSGNAMTASRDRSPAAAIDIGSNSIKMTVARPDANGGVEQFDWSSEVVRLGQGVEDSGRLDDERIEAALQTLQRFAARARELGAQQVMAVATDATRNASNGEAFLRRVEEETGIAVRVLDGDAEAAMTFRGIAATTDMAGPVVIADIGGGSTELIVAHDGAMTAARSVALGSGRLTDRLVRADPPTAEEIAASEAAADTALADAIEALAMPIGAGTRLMLVGGTGEFMARLLPDPQHVTSRGVRQVLSRLRRLSAAALAAEIDIPESRARVLPAGVAIVAAIVKRVRPSRIEITHSGVRAGLLQEIFSDIAANGATPPQTAAEDARAVGTETAFALDPIPSGKSKAPAPGFRDTMNALIAERWGVVLATIPAALDGVDIEGVHDVRVASRRLRAAMDIAAPLFTRRWYKALHRTAKEITGALGEVRDRDVLLEALQAGRDAAPLAEHPGIDRLMDRIERERAAARVEMERYLRELLAGPLPKEIERRFGPIAGRDLAPGGPEVSAS